MALLADMAGALAPTLERLNARADLSTKGLKQSAGLMVNYRCDLGGIETGHDRFVKGREVHSRTISAMLGRRL